MVLFKIYLVTCTKGRETSIQRRLKIETSCHLVEVLLLVHLSPETSCHLVEVLLLVHLSPASPALSHLESIFKH